MDLLEETLDIKYTKKKMSKDIRLHDLGSQLSSPKSEITAPENHYRSNLDLYIMSYRFVENVMHQKLNCLVVVANSINR